MAKAAADRLFEMTVLVRRAKKEKWMKHEEEAAAKGSDDHHPVHLPHMDKDSIDAMFYMQDYPSNKAEALALARHSYALNGVFEVNEVPKTDAEDVEEEENDEDGSDEDEDSEDK